jgi:uncharacterized membrane protein
MPYDDTIETSVSIKRSVADVFRFYRDFTNLPKFLGDVMAVHQLDPVTYRWTIQGPLRIQANWTVKVSQERNNESIHYETITSPALKTHWGIHFAPGSTADETELREVMKGPFGRLGRAALALIGKFPAEEASSNLHRLKQLMETGKVTDKSYSVAGKFE